MTPESKQDRESARGHRVLPHTADLVVEAWGESRSACLEEAARGLVATFADTSKINVTQIVPFALEPGSDRELLVQLLQEIVYVIDVLGVVPVRTEVESTEDGGVAGFFDVAPVDTVELIGAVPKGVSRHELHIGPNDGRWSCQAIVDV